MKLTKNVIQWKLNKFATYLAARRGLAETTINLDTGFVRRAAPKIGLRPNHVDVDNYVANLYKDKSASYICCACTAFERYMEYIDNPIKLGRPRKPSRRTINPLTEAEVAVLIANTKSIRERAILVVLAYSGVRNQELCDLKIRNIDVISNTVTIESGKGSKSRTVCFAPAGMKILVECLQPLDRQPNDFLFTTVRHGNQYTTQDIRKLLRKCAKQAGIEKRVYPHLLRHTLATSMLHRGAHLLTIKEQLGHEFISSTMFYLHAAKDRLQADYLMYVPSYV